MLDDIPNRQSNNGLTNSESENLNVRTKTQRNKYICPQKGCYLIPRIISVHSDTGRIVMQCPNNHLDEKNVEDYLKILDEKKDLEPKEHERRIENYDKDKSNKETLIAETKSNEINIIEEKCKDISNIIRAFNQLLLAQENQPDNYLHNQNLINLGDFILSENSRFFDDIKQSSEIKNGIQKDNKYTEKFDNIIQELIEDNEENEKTALNNLKTEFGIDLEKHYQKKDLRLKLKGLKTEDKYKKLDDIGFQYISEIRFKNLIEINLANNKITDLNYLNRMLLPHLEIINFSYNKIANIEPVANLLSKNLFEIYLHYNQIEDLKPFENPKFPIQSLEIFRIDNNKFKVEDPELKILVEKYKNKMIYEIKGWDGLNKKYKCNIDEKSTKIDLSSRRDSDIIYYLFPLVMFPNNIQILILDNNRIQDASLLAKMPIYHLEYLDLSLNLISSIIFLKKLSTKSKDLEILYLHDNKINDISPLYNYNNEKEETKNQEGKEQIDIIFQNLEILSLKNNSLDLKDSTTYEFLDSIIKNGDITLDYKKEDMPEPPKKISDSNNIKESECHLGEIGAANAANAIKDK